MSFTGSASPNPGVLGDNPTSNTALRLALQAMKERCQQLQNRLSMLEEENLQLRIERHSIPEAQKKDSVDKFNADSSALLKKVEELSRQKSKLSHHIFMVANENKHLWEHLSKLTDEKGLEGSPGTGDASSSIGAFKPKRSLRTIDRHREGNQLSLDEIPLRISPSYHKTGSPNQIEWNTTTSIKDCEYPIIDVDDEDAEMDGIVQSELMEILANFEEEKKLLRQQQQGLKAAIEVISKLNFRGAAHPNYQAVMKESDDTQTCSLDDYENMHSLGSEIDETNRSEGEVMKVANGIAMRNKENNFEDRICPLCTKFYAKSTPFDEFNDHVLSHFVEDSEQDSHLSFHEIVA